jgi:hypothetical protein
MQKGKYYMIPFISLSSQVHKTQSRIVLPAGGGKWDLVFTGYSISVWEEEKVLEVHMVTS